MLLLRPSTRVHQGSHPSCPSPPPLLPLPALLPPHKGSSPQRTHLAGSGVLLSGLADGVTSVIPMLVTTWLRPRSKPRPKCEHIYTHLDHRTRLLVRLCVCVSVCRFLSLFSLPLLPVLSASLHLSVSRPSISILPWQPLLLSLLSLSLSLSIPHTHPSPASFKVFLFTLDNCLTQKEDQKGEHDII